MHPRTVWTTNLLSPSLPRSHMRKPPKLLGLALSRHRSAPAMATVMAKGQWTLPGAQQPAPVQRLQPTTLVLGKRVPTTLRCPRATPRPASTGHMQQLVLLPSMLHMLLREARSGQCRQGHRRWGVWWARESVLQFVLKYRGRGTCQQLMMLRGMASSQQTAGSRPAHLHQ